jgi:hypothetical protein
LSVLLASGCGASRSNGDGGGPKDLSACQGVGCNVMNCPQGTDTTVAGTLYAPNGVDPVPNATIYVPATAPAAFPNGVACDLCGTISGVVTSTVTRHDGGFTLTGVPVGANVQIVAELGRFRAVRSMNVEYCKSNIVPKDPNTFGIRLPGKDADLNPGDRVPKIAVATGEFDQIECVLKRMGLSQIDLYNDRSGAPLPATIATFESLLTDPAKMKTYNIIFVNCTKAEDFEPTLKKAGVLKNIEDYVASGGRLYATDWAYDVIHQVPEFAQAICFVEGGVDGPAPPMTCPTAPLAPEAAHSNTKWDTSAKIKDLTMEKWLGNFTNTIINGVVPVAFNFVVINRTADTSKVFAEGEAMSAGGLPLQAKGVRPLTVTFDYKQCGRVHYSSYNTEPNAGVFDAPTTRYPMCDMRTTFNPQERMLEYLIFETAQCIGPIL